MSAMRNVWSFPSRVTLCQRDFGQNIVSLRSRAAVTRGQRIGHVLGVVLPVAGLILAIVLLCDRWVDPGTLPITLFMYALAGMGITVGFHRLFSHRSFEARQPVRATFAVLGSMAMQGPIIRWVANHRTHHAHPDKEGDPH